MFNEASLKFVPRSIWLDGQFIHPVIRLFTATLNPSRHPTGLSFFWMGLFCGSSSVFLGGFVFVTTAVVAQTQQTEHFF